jgi:hypothetical protein
LFESIPRQREKRDSFAKQPKPSFVNLKSDVLKMAEGNYKHVYKFNVAMSCGGCSGAVTRVLKRSNLRNLSDPEDTEKGRKSSA